eukprot:scaffold26711_cov196-Skeletonema_menzelii.AAC.4
MESSRFERRIREYVGRMKSNGSKSNRRSMALEMICKKYRVNHSAGQMLFQLLSVPQSYTLPTTNKKLHYQQYSYFDESLHSWEHV